MRFARQAYEPLLRTALNARGLVVTGAVVLVVLCLLLASRMGSEFIPSLDEGDIAMHALRIPGTSLTQAVQMQDMLEKRIKEIPGGEGGIRQTRHGRDRHRPDAAKRERTPGSCSRPRHGWPDPSKPKAQLVAEMEAAVNAIPGNNYEFTQPIQMRFNELISGVRAMWRSRFSATISM